MARLAAERQSKKVTELRDFSGLDTLGIRSDKFYPENPDGPSNGERARIEGARRFKSSPLVQRS